MFDPENALKQAVSAFHPSDAVFTRVKNRIYNTVKQTRSSVTLISVNKDSRKIFDAVFKKYDKLMQKIA